MQVLTYDSGDGGRRGRKNYGELELFCADVGGGLVLNHRSLRSYCWLDYEEEEEGSEEEKEEFAGQLRISRGQRLLTQTLHCKIDYHRAETGLS